MVAVDGCIGRIDSNRLRSNPIIQIWSVLIGQNRAKMLVTRDDAKTYQPSIIRGNRKQEVVETLIKGNESRDFMAEC